MYMKNRFFTTTKLSDKTWICLKKGVHVTWHNILGFLRYLEDKF